MAKTSRDGFNRLLALLPHAESALLRKHLTDFSSPAGTVVQEPGDAIEYVYFPHSGMVSLLAVLENGDSVEVATIGNEGVVGTGTETAITRGVVQIELVASRISRRAFRECVDGNPVLSRLVAIANEILLGQVQQTAACNALHQIENRLARWLLQAHDRTIGDHVPLTQDFLSQMLGVRRTSVTAIAQSLQEKGLIKYQRGNIEIVDRDGLEKTACECYGVLSQQAQRLLAKPLA